MVPEERDEGHGTALQIQHPGLIQIYLHQGLLASEQRAVELEDGGSEVAVDVADDVAMQRVGVGHVRAHQRLERSTVLYLLGWIGVVRFLVRQFS